MRPQGTAWYSRYSYSLLSVIRVFIVLLVLITPTLLPTTVQSQGKPVILTVDVWTSKGGQGQGASGGSYNVGEQVVIYVKASVSCQARLTTMGPGGSYGSQLSLPTNSAQQITLGRAEQSDAGMWQVKLEAAWENQYDADLTSFTVIGTAPPKPPTTTIPVLPTPPPTTPPPTTPTLPPVTPPTPPPPSSGQPGTKTLAKIGPDTADEFLALLTLKMTEGILTGDLNMDANKDGKVTLEDVHQILQWSVDKGTGGSSTQPSGGKTGGTASATSSLNKQALVGNWEMKRLTLDAPFPKEVPGAVIDMFIPKTGTWEISRNPDQLTIKYDGGATWYKEPFFMMGALTEKTTSTQEKNDGLSCTFQTPVTFAIASVPFGSIEQIQGSFMSTVTISVSGNNVDSVCTINNVTGSYVKDENGKKTTSSISFAGIKATYSGVKK